MDKCARLVIYNIFILSSVRLFAIIESLDYYTKSYIIYIVEQLNGYLS